MRDEGHLFARTIQRLRCPRCMATAYRVLFSVERVGHRFVDFDATAIPQAVVAGRRWKNTDLNATANTEQTVTCR